jgi:hypothetical protein
MKPLKESDILWEFQLQTHYVTYERKAYRLWQNGATSATLVATCGYEFYRAIDYFITVIKRTMPKLDLDLHDTQVVEKLFQATYELLEIKPGYLDLTQKELRNLRLKIYRQLNTKTY